jgi:hypothetical protein
MIQNIGEVRSLQKFGYPTVRYRRHGNPERRSVARDSSMVDPSPFTQLSPSTASYI